MNELTFKVFDKVSKKISPPFSVFGEFTLLGAWSSWVAHVRDASEVSIGLSCLADLVLLRSTGVKDINGVEIYEKDIVHWGHIKGYEENYPRKAVVEFSPDLSFKTFNLGECDHTFRFGNFTYRSTENALEVIGHSLSSPELALQVDDYS